MTRKNLFMLLVAVVLISSATLSTASATNVDVNQMVSEELETVYITWQYPIPPSEKGDKLNMSVGVLLNGVTYASHDVFTVLDIPKCPKCEGTILTVDGVTGVYYPLRASAEQFGYSVLWAPRSEHNGKVVKYWVYLAQQEPDKVWIETKSTPDPGDNYTLYEHHYVYSDETTYWWFVSEDETFTVPHEKATIVE